MLVFELIWRPVSKTDLRLSGATVVDPEVFLALVRYIERGEIKPLVAATFPLPEIVAAQQMFMRKEHVGKLVLIPPSHPGID